MEKQCTKCGVRKPLSLFYRRNNYNGSGTTYYKSECKECAKDRTERWKIKNPKRYLDYQKAYKELHGKTNQAKRQHRTYRGGEGDDD